MNKPTKKSLVEVIREGNISEYHLTLHKYFGELDNLVQVNQDWSKFEGLNARYYLEDFITDKGYDFQIFSYIEDGTLYPSKFSDVEVAPEKVHNCLEQGALFLQSKTNKDVKFILNVSDSRYERIFEIVIVTTKKDRQIAEAFLRDFREYINENNVFKTAKLQGDLRFLKFDKEYSWDDLIIDDITMKDLQRNLTTVLENRELYNTLGISSKRGVILSGDPGTGKTMVGKILCNTMPDWSFLWISPGDLSRISDLKRFCDIAKRITPCIIFLEDLDLHFQSRDANGFSSMLGELMNQMDGIETLSNIVVIGTTNRPKQLEDALIRRPGRFDRVIHFGKPDASSRQRMFESFGKGKLDKTIDWKPILKATDGFTGAQIKEVLNQGFLNRISSPDFKQNGPILLTTDELLMGAAACAGKEFSPSMGFNPSGAPVESEGFD